MLGAIAQGLSLKDIGYIFLNIGYVFLNIAYVFRDIAYVFAPGWNLSGKGAQAQG